MSQGEQQVRVGVGGLGRMGAPMARRLLAAGLPVTVFNRSPGPARELAEQGAALAADPAALARASDVVLTSLAGPEAARAVVADPASGLVAGAHSGLVVVETSTIGPAVARELARAVEQAGARFVDAPVSGSVPAVEAGTLAFLAGGEADDLERVAPVLHHLGRVVRHLGPVGAGAATKLAVNAVLAVYSNAVGEALRLAEALGVERAAAYDALADSAIGAPYLGYKRAAFLEPDPPVAFTIEGLAKDVRLALEAGESAGVPLPAVARAGERLAAAIAAGGGARDIAQVETRSA